jgi:spermidine/putrescine transport system substrate-binding protein
MRRRHLLQAAGLAAAGLPLAACGTPAARQTPKTCTTQDLSGTEKTLSFSNWPQYVDTDDAGKRPTLEAFQASTGITVSYTEDVNDNNQFFGKVQKSLAECQPGQRDIVVLSDWLVGRLVKLGWVQKLDLAKLPNVQANLLPSLRGRSVDPTNSYAVPWQGGLTAIAYNGDATKEVRTVDELLTRADLKGRVTLLKEMRDTMGLLLQSNGHDPANFTAAQFDDALAKLKKAVDSGQVRKFTGNEYTTDLAKGDVAACFGWSGDVLQLAAENDKIRFVAPDSGVLIYSDDMVVLNGGAHKANAEALMNYYYDPAVAAKVAASVNYICPVRNAQAELAKTDAELAADPLIFPTPELLRTAKGFMALDENAARGYEQKFQTVIGT